MDLDRVGTHISRAGAVIGALGWLAERYGYLMSWEDPVSTCVIMVLFVYSCLFVQAEYALCVPLFIIVVLFTESWINRHFGHYRKRLITPTVDPLETYTYRPVSYLRLAVSGFRNFGRHGVPKTPPPYMSLSYLPEGPVGNVHLATLDGNRSTFHPSTSSSSSNVPKKGVVVDDHHPELQIASFYVPSTLLGAQDVPVRRGRGLVRSLSSNLTGGAITSIMSSLNIVQSEKILNDTILHNVSLPWRRKLGKVARLVTKALMKNDSNTLGMDSSNGKNNSAQAEEAGERDLQQRMQRVHNYLEESDVSFVYPILKKPRSIGLSSSAAEDKSSGKCTENRPEKRCTTKPSTQKNIATQFEPWSASSAVLKYTLRGSSSGSEGKTMDNTWGYIYVPLKAVARAMATKDVEGKALRGSGNGSDDADEEVCVWCDVQWTPSFSRTFTSSDYSENIGDLDNPYSVMTSASRQDSDKVVEDTHDSDEERSHDESFVADIPVLQRALPFPQNSDPHLQPEKKSNPCRAQVLLRISLSKTQPSVPVPIPVPTGASAASSPHDAKDYSVSSSAAKIGLPGVSPRDLDISRIVQSIVNPKEVKKSSTISTLWNARDHIKFVQNKLGGVVGTVESFKNLFNWTQPVKTLPLYLLIVGVWILSVFIPGRYLILALGLSEFLYVFSPQPEVLPVKTRIYNLLSSVPNDDDLKEVYAAERASFMASHDDKLKRQRQELKLNMVQTCLWQGWVAISRDSRAAGGKSSSSARSLQGRSQVMGKVGGIGGSDRWDERFLAVQGHRLVWWSSEDDVDSGLGPIADVLLHGHAGITQVSPLDIKELGDDTRLIAVFGRDALGLPLKHTILCQDPAACQQLKAVVNAILELNAE